MASTIADVSDSTDAESSSKGNAPAVDEASVVIVGGGPHALAALACLHDGVEADESAENKTPVCVIDPGSHFMQSWNSRFDALEIKSLRSPTLAHPAAFDPTALLDYATRENRTSELMDAPVAAGHGKKAWLASTDLSDRGAQLKALPSNALFRDFCASLEKTLPHRWLSGKATSVCKDASTGKFRVHYRATAGEQERTVVARAVILATGPVGKWAIPTPFEPHLHDASRLILHTEDLLAHGTGTLSEEITRRCPGESARVLVIGGGISAAQAALAAFRAGHQVVLRSRRPLATRAFDIGAEWLDVRSADRLRFEFLCLPMKQRGKAVRDAAAGGSVPANYMEELHSLSKASGGALQIEVDEDIECSEVCVGADGQSLVVNGETFGMVILATGVVTAPSSSPLYTSVAEGFNAPLVDGFPRVDPKLRWMAGQNLFVLGANAMLELGPGGGNLMGAMRGARVVSYELHSLMNPGVDRRDAEARGFQVNQYVSLGDRVRFGDGGDAEVDFLAQQLKLTPHAEANLRKAQKAHASQKNSKATPYLKGASLKGTLKGERDPMGNGGNGLHPRTRYATYW